MNFVDKVKILQNHFNAGNFKNVIEGCKTLDKKFPNNSFILNLSGMAYQGLINHHKAIEFFELALKADNRNIAAMNNLANSFKNTHQYLKADQIFKKIVKDNPNYLNALNNYANVKSEVNDIEGAIQLYNKALVVAKKKKINFLIILINLAASYQSINKKKESLETIQEIFKLDPNNVRAHKLLSEIYKYSEKNEETIAHLVKMEDILKRNDLNDSQKESITFAIGKAYDDLKNAKKAVEFFFSGNKLHLKTSKSNLTEEVNVISNVKKIFNNIDLNVSHKIFSKRKIIFICGMPRSGTTLVEQIISSHKKVYGAGELSFLTNVVKKNFFISDELNEQKIIEHKNFLKNLINDEYFEKFSLHNIDEQIITDKALFNFNWIGLIKIFFPNSKIVHCKRNPQDNCLSIYKNNFSSTDLNWTYDQKDISNYYNNYNALMKFWYSKTPEFIHTVEYEKIVSDKEKEIKRLLKFCELEWDDNCVNYHKNVKTPIKTVSISQAREPIYNSSVNSSNNYKEYLKEMFENLI
jgi:tetratricopeptide (TPR) repeat protein